MELINLLNGVWGGGLEALLGFLGLLAALPTVWWFLLPRYTAIVCHDGVRWLDKPGEWSSARGVAGGDLALWPPSYLSKTFFEGKRLGDADAQLSDSPIVRRYQIVWFGRRRGVYYAIPIRIYSQQVLDRFGRSNRPLFKWEEAEPHPPLD